MDKNLNFKPSLGADPLETEHHPELDPIVQDAIGQAIKDHYQSLVDLPLPSSMLEILAKIAARERQDK
ncbi:MAG: hypothetical protein EBY21_08740 [Alphaproteobacteria bacterium]|nr:hypothetical protein [Alphaproteobacteria bacterium]